MSTWFCDNLTESSCTGIIHKLCSTLQTLPNLGNSYFAEGQTSFGIEFTYGQLYTYIWVLMKSGIQQTGTWPAATRPLRRLCYRPSVTFQHLRLILLLFQQRKMRWAFQKVGKVPVLTLRYFSSVVKHIFHRQTFCLQHRIICV